MDGNWHEDVETLDVRMVDKRLRDAFLKVLSDNAINPSFEPKLTGEQTKRWLEFLEK